MKKYLYQIEQGKPVLVEVADYNPVVHARWKALREYLDKCTRIIIIPPVPAQWKEGEYYEEGKDFKIAYRYFLCGIKDERPSEWVYSSKEFCEQYYKDDYETVAIPIADSTEQKEETQNELLIALIEIFKLTLTHFIVKGYSEKLGYHFWPVEETYFISNYELAGKKGTP